AEPAPREDPGHPGDAAGRLDLHRGVRGTGGPAASAVLLAVRLLRDAGPGPGHRRLGDRERLCVDHAGHLRPDRPRAPRLGPGLGLETVAPTLPRQGRGRAAPPRPAAAAS